MGRTLLGGVSQEGQAELLTPEQQQFLSGTLGSQDGAAQQAYGDFLKPYQPEEFESFYQQSFIDPAQKALKEQIIPGLKEQFLGLDESGSSDLNRALAQSAGDVSTALGSGILGQYNQTQQNRMGALGGLQGLLGQRSFEPIIHQQQGILPGLINALAGGAGSFLNMGR